MTRAFGLFLAVFCACGPREDITPQIEVSPNVAGRYHLMPGHAPDDGPIGQREDMPATPAFARELTDANAASATSSVAQAGDFVIGNSEIEIVVRGKIGDPFSLVEITDQAHKKSGLGGVAFGTLVASDGSRVALVVEKVSTFTTSDGSAVLTARGHFGAHHAETMLRLAKTDRAALITTTIDNETPEKYGPFDSTDEAHWGDATIVLPGRSPAESTDGDFKGPYLGGVGAVASYAFTSTTGEVDATVHGKDAVFHLARAAVIDPHSQKSFDRVLVVGTRADTSSLVAELTRASDGPLARLTVVVYSASHRVPALDLPAKLILRTPIGDDALTIAVTHENPIIADIPPGQFTVRSATQDPHAGATFQTRASESVSVNLVVP